MIVPKEITRDIELLFSKLNTLEKSQYIPCRPSPNAPQNECFPLVEAKVKSDGGSQVLGWQIWQTKLLVEAEFHVVWKSPINGLVDITPKSMPCSKILFVADPKAVYEGKQVSNIRINTTGNSLVDDLIAVYEAVFRIENKGERALQYELSLSGSETRAYKILDEAKPMLELMALHGDTRKSPCPCKSGKRYKVCHGKKIRKLVNDF